MNNEGYESQFDYKALEHESRLVWILSTLNFVISGLNLGVIYYLLKATK